MKQVKIICRKPGFRRAGIAHDAEKTHPIDAFSEEQWAILEADPMFALVPVSEMENGDRLTAIKEAIGKLSEGVNPTVKAVGALLDFKPRGDEIAEVLKEINE